MTGRSVCSPARVLGGTGPGVDVILPPRLRPGSHLRVIAPARSRALVLENDHSEIAERRLHELGFTVSYGAHVDERDRYDSSPVESRLADLHDAFADPQVDGVLWLPGWDRRAARHPTTGRLTAHADGAWV
jgi:LD-carboxypeptidase N-terminal domain